MLNKKNRIIIIASIILLLINKNILFGQNTEIELFQGKWLAIPLSQLGLALMSNSYFLVEGFEFSNGTFKFFRMEGRGLLAMANPTVLNEGKFTVNTVKKTIDLIDVFNVKTTLQYAFSDENNTLRFRRVDGVTFTFYK